MWYCEVCKMDIIIIIKSSNIKSDSYKRKEVVSRTNNNLTDETYTYLSPEFHPVDDSVKRTLMFAFNISTDINVNVYLL